MKNSKQFIRNEDGIATVWSIFWLVLCFSISGLAVDTTNAWKIKQLLQSTADAAAHAGALELGTVGNDLIVEVVYLFFDQRVGKGHSTPTETLC